MRVLGVDDAGRGCVIGPLVVAGVLVDESSQSKLLKIGVKDSKLLSRRRRTQLFGEIKQIAIATHVVKVSPTEIDKVVNSRRRLHKLNRLEAQAMAIVIKMLRPDVAIVDASDVLADRYRRHIAELLSFQVKVISEHKADRNYPVVSAASIIAKVERDDSIEKLKTQYGDFGSGYMTDSKTKVFIESLIKECGSYPDFVRSSWKPAKVAKMNARTKQTKLHREMAKA